MTADSNSRIAWHRAQIRRHRDALQRIEGTRFSVGESPDARALARSQALVAELTAKIRQSEQVIAQHDRETRRPLGTDLRSLSKVDWSDWNAHSDGQR
jgi:hypothetical protein